MAAREGSYGACRALLDAHANREITDHMERLPRDVAAERVHDDIVRLLDEHAPRAPPHPHNHHHTLLSEYKNMKTVSFERSNSQIFLHHFLASPNHHQLISHPTVIGANSIGGSKQNKSKKQRNNKASPNSPVDGLIIESSLQHQSVRRYVELK